MKWCEIKCEEMDEVMKQWCEINRMKCDEMDEVCDEM